MSEILAMLLLAAALIGHAGLWIYAVNWLHSTRLPHRITKACTVVLRVVLVGGPLALGWWLMTEPAARQMLFSPTGLTRELPLVLRVYLGACILIAIGPVLAGAWRRITFRDPSQLLANHTQAVAFSKSELAGPGVGNLVRLPGNQSVQLRVAEKRLEIAGLDPRLHGLRIAHLSDLHFTGRIRKEFFERVVTLTQQSRPDLIVIAGDLVDKDSCIDWIPEVLGRLHAPLGVYAVLGNHDVRVNVDRLRKAVEETGIELIGQRWLTMRHAGAPIILAGNELPWFRPAADVDDCPELVEGDRPLRMLLSHSPDQLLWARQRAFDLMLAGHTHGGQIRLPVWGPIVSPSCYGTKYASGTFFESPTLMHVSRGVSGKLPLRWNCPPELPILVLQTDREVT